MNTFWTTKHERYMFLTIYIRMYVYGNKYPVEAKYVYSVNFC